MASTNSIASIEQALGQAVIDALITAELAPAGDPTPAAPLLYHGAPPDDCCPPVGEDARVLVWWTTIGRSTPGARSGNCADPMTVEINVRYVCCWPTPENPLAVDVAAEFSPIAALLAQIGWVGTQALAAKLGICGDDDLGKIGQRQAFGDGLGLSNPTMTNGRARPPRGGCTGIDWTVAFTPTGVDVAHWMEPLAEPEP